MLKIVRITLVILFVLALLVAGGLFFYNRTHEDNTPPVIQSDNDLLEVSVTDPSEALLQGLSARDNVDGDLSAEIRVKDISTLINDTDVTVSYIVFDQASNYAVFSRVVRYRDYSPPRFELLQPMIFNMGETVKFNGSIQVIDQRDGDISGRLKLEESTVLNDTPGTYTARFSVTNRMGDTVELPLTVQIVDKSASRPSITLSDNLIYLEQGGKINFRRLVSEVKDPMAEDQEKIIPISRVSVNDSAVDTGTPGVYEVYYYYTGISGEIATVILTVVVE